MIIRVSPEDEVVFCAVLKGDVNGRIVMLQEDAIQQQPTDTSIAVPERMDVLELIMHDGCQRKTLAEYETYCREKFGYFPEQFIQEWIIDHEHEHAIVAERYGLKATYGLFAVGKIPLQPFLMDYLSEGARGWDKERLLDYLRETSEEPDDPSEGDKLVSDTIQGK